MGSPAFPASTGVNPLAGWLTSGGPASGLMGGMPSMGSGMFGAANPLGQLTGGNMIPGLSGGSNPLGQLSSMVNPINVNQPNLATQALSNPSTLMQMAGQSGLPQLANNPTLASSVASNPGAVNTLLASTATQSYLSGSALPQFLTDTNGMTLYMYTKDSCGKSACYGSCAVKWPPLTNPSLLPASVNSSLVSSTKRSDGSTQVMYNGYPLYYYYKDKNPGDYNGQGVKGTWYMINMNGKPINGALDCLLLDALNANNILKYFKWCEEAMNNYTMFEEFQEWKHLFNWCKRTGRPLRNKDDVLSYIGGGGHGGGGGGGGHGNGGKGYGGGGHGG